MNAPESRGWPSRAASRRSWRRRVRVAALALLASTACATVRPLPADLTDPPTRRLTLLLTADEHGWLEPHHDVATSRLEGGVIAMYARLVAEGLGGPDVLLFSAGDMWTGPYESTLLEGQPMVAAFNRIGYHAVAVGNHEFDFGVDTLVRRSGEAAFPLLAANLADAGSGRRPDWVGDSSVIEAAGLRVGVVGFSHRDTPRLTDPRNVAGFVFHDYEQALRNEARRLRERGAEVLVALFHVDLDGVRSLVPALRELGFVAVGAGHAHRSQRMIDDNDTPSPVDDLVLCNPGPYLRSYCRITLEFRDRALTGRAVDVFPVARPVGGPDPPRDRALETILADARARIGELGAERIVELEATLEPGTLGRMLVESWLAYLPGTRAAVTNDGAVRQALPAGPTRLRDIISALPFDNTLVVVQVTGRQLREVLSNPASIAAGVRLATTADGNVALERNDGTPVGDDEVLDVVISDFMYLGGDRYDFSSYDPEPEWTAIDWREPLVERLRTTGLGAN